MLSGGQGSIVNQYSGDMVAKNVYLATHPEDYVKRMQEELSYINVDPVKWVADRVTNDMRDYMQGHAGVPYQGIDPDIRNMKSITESAKMRIYYERRAKRQLESQRESLTSRIAEHLGLKDWGEKIYK